MGGSPGGFDMNNPFMAGLMALFASQNPQHAGPMLDQMGVPPPMGLGGGAGAFAQPNLGGMVGGDDVPEFPPRTNAPPQFSPQPPPSVAPLPALDLLPPSPGASEGMSLAGGGQPPGTTPAAGQMSPTQLLQLAAMGGVKAPQPIQPIMNGGVTGGVKPPEVQLGGGFGTGVPAGVAMLLQAMAGGQRQNPLIAPDLGSLVRGRG